MSETDWNKNSLVEELHSSTPEQALGMLLLDLRSPTNTFMNCARFLSEADLHEEQLKAIEDISKQARIIYDYLNIVLDYMKEHRGQNQSTDESGS